MANKDTPQPEVMIALFEQVEDSDRPWKAIMKAASAGRIGHD